MTRAEELATRPRTIGPAVSGDPLLGPLSTLPGRWTSRGRGWNMIALPFAAADSGGLDYRLLLNQFDEQLDVLLVDEGVPNRGLDATSAQDDQHVVTLDYQQVVHQVAAVDRPESTERGGAGLAIHHEPGLFLNLVDRVEGDADVARLATIPHGDAVLAMGTSAVVDGAPLVPAVDGLPVGAGGDLDGPYLAPYRFFRDHPFVGDVTAAGFPGFDPTAPQRLLEVANDGVQITRTTVLDMSTSTATGGIHNVPFIVAQANAASMRSIFWIQEVAGDPVTLRLQYLQIVMLEFFPRLDGTPGRIAWPHVSINTLDRVADA